MVAPVFFLLLMGTIEAGLIFFAQSALQSAVNDAARLVRTGQTTCFTGSGSTCAAMTQAQFRPQICNEVGALLADCSGASLQFDVTPYSAGFGSASQFCSAQLSEADGRAFGQEVEKAAALVQEFQLFARMQQAWRRQGTVQ